MSEMLEVVIDSVRVSLMSPQRLVVLRQVDSDRYLPIWVGPYEAEAITVALQEIEMIRPLTHDLLKNIITQFNGRITRVEILSLKEEIFYGNIVIESNGETVNIDARPSDSIALAVRAHVPIMVDEAVMISGGLMPEQDISKDNASATRGALQSPSSSSASTRTTPRPISNEESSRLSVFEDFLSSLGNEPKPKDKDEDKGSDKPDNEPDKE